MSKANTKTEQRTRRRNRIRAKVSGTAAVPRLAVFKSLKYIYVQLIDDENGVTLAAATSKGAKGNGKPEGKTVAAKLIGTEIAKKAADKKITKVVFDRGGYIYTGRVKALADGAREGGLNF
jgi:large subunit ribosomal protein L18